jgi:uncharacterized LabA/DUF88 family protein
MTDYNTSTKVVNKSCSRTEAENIKINAINCQIYRLAVIAEYNEELDRISLYDFDKHLNNQKIVHVHLVDERTRNIVLEMIAVERKLLDDVDPNDYHYKVEKEFVR